MYKCLTHRSLQDNDGYQIVPIRYEDIEQIRIWRNAKIDILRQQQPISFEDQQTYFREIIQPYFNEKYPKQLLFSFLFHGGCIGYGGIVYIDWISLRGEVSFLVDPIRIQNDDTYHCDFLHFLNLISQMAFQDLKFHRLYGETYAFRQKQIAILEEFGFKQEGILRQHVYKREKWEDSVLQGILFNEWSALKSGHPSKKVSNVLVTSISKKMPLLTSVRKAAIQTGQFSKIYGCDSHSLCIGKYGVDEFWHCPSLEKLTLHQLILYCQENQITAIIPTRNGDLEFYALHLPSLRKEGIHVMVSSSETILACLDKKMFADGLLKNQFPIIPTFLSLEEFESPFYVVKDRKGAGSQKLGLRLNRESANAHAKQLKDPIFQPYIEGKEWSIDLYRSFQGHVMGCVARERNMVVEGESQITTTKHHPALENLCKKMADCLNIHGHAVFQCIEDKKGRLHVIECNPRFGGASTASLAVGLDSFAWFFLECAGEDLQRFPFMRSNEDIRQIRYSTDRILPWSSSLI